MIPASAIADAKAAQTQTGASDLAAALALAVAGPESGYNPNAIGDSGSSFGLTQLHNNNLGDGGGLGNGYSEATLLDPVQNLSIAMRYIQGQLNNGASAYDAIGPWSTKDTAINNLAEAQTALGQAVTATGGGVPKALVGLAIVVGAVALLEWV